MERSGGLVDRNGEKEPAPFSELALEPDATAVQLDELARDGETKSGPMVRARRRRVDLSELPEDQIVMLRRNAEPSVADFNEERREAVRLPSRRTDPHAPAGWRELDRVAEQVPDDVRDLLAIGVDAWEIRLRLD